MLKIFIFQLQNISLIVLYILTTLFVMVRACRNIALNHLQHFSYKKQIRIRYIKMHPQENLPYKKRIENRQSQEVSFQSASYTTIDFKVSRDINWQIQSKIND